MAVRAFTTEHIGPNAIRITWTGLLTGDTGEPYAGHQDAIRLIQVTGTYQTAVAATLTLKGSLERNVGAPTSVTPTNYHSLHDPQGNDISYTSAGTPNRIEQVQEGPLTYRPEVAGGDGGTDLTVIVIECIRSQK